MTSTHDWLGLGGSEGLEAYDGISNARLGGPSSTCHKQNITLRAVFHGVDRKPHIQFVDGDGLGKDKLLFLLPGSGVRCHTPPWCGSLIGPPPGYKSPIIKEGFISGNCDRRHAKLQIAAPSNINY